MSNELKIEDGGPAFHSITIKDGDNYNAPTKYYHKGMSLRDWFAGQALASMTVAPDYSKGHCNQAMADRAYNIADHMLERRKK